MDKCFWINISPKKTYKWTTGIWKAAQISYSSREMKIKITLTEPYNTEILFKNPNKEMELLHTYKCKLIQPLWKTVWSFHNKLYIKVPYNSPILILCV
jgi:hypothetical protein